MAKRLIALAALLIAVSCSKAPSPTSPTPPPTPPVIPTTTALTVTAAPPTAAGVQLAATITLSDNTTKEITTAATWTSSNPGRATVSRTGFVTVLTAGDVDFSAAYQSMTGSLHLVVVPPKWALTGRVSPVFPNTPSQLMGVTVSLTAGPDAGLTAVTDANGHFSLANLQPGIVDLRIEASGYSAWTLSGLHLTSDQTINASLFPIPPRDETGASATGQCKDATWTWTQTPDNACAAQGGLAWGACPGPLCESN